MSERPPRVLVTSGVVAVVVGAALVVGEQGGSSADDAPAGERSGPRIVTPEEFCAGFGELFDARESLLTSQVPQTTRTLKDAATAVGDLAEGTAMSEEAQAGMVYLVTAFLSLDDDASAQDVVEVDDFASVTDTAHAEALASYIGENCRSSAISNAR